MKLVLGAVFFISYVSSSQDFCGWTRNSYSPLTRGLNGVNYILKQVHIITRHGDRTVEKAQECWPNDTAVWDCSLTSAATSTVKHDYHSLEVDRVYRKVFIPGREVFPGDCYVGQLTLKGYEQHEYNGQLLRKAYVDSSFISRNYNHSEHYIRSDDLPRTLQSAHALAQGLFPVRKPPSGNAEVVDIHTMDMVMDDIIPNARLCPKLLQFMKEWMASETFREHYNTVTKPLLEDVGKALGLTMPIDLTHVADCIVVHLCHRKTIPEAITSELEQRIAREFEWKARGSYSFPSVQENSRVGIGFLIKEIWDEMKKAMEGDGKKLYVFSGHDSTVMPVLTALNLSDSEWSPYGSMIQLELYEVTGDPKLNAVLPNFAVRMIYNGKELKFTFCDASPCSIQQFEKYVKTIIPGPDLKANCEVKNMVNGVWFEPVRSMLQKLVRMQGL